MPTREEVAGGVWTSRQDSFPYRRRSEGETKEIKILVGQSEELHDSTEQRRAVPCGRPPLKIKQNEAPRFLSSLVFHLQGTSGDPHVPKGGPSPRGATPCPEVIANAVPAPRQTPPPCRCFPARHGQHRNIWPPPSPNSDGPGTPGAAPARDRYVTTWLLGEGARGGDISRGKGRGVLEGFSVGFFQDLLRYFDGSLAFLLSVFTLRIEEVGKQRGLRHSSPTQEG